MDIRVSVTGHRLKTLGYGADVIKKLDVVAGLALLEHIHGDDYVVLTGMALGWDQAIARMAIQFGMKFEAFVPFIGQDSMWPDDTKLQYRAMLKKASKVHTMYDHTPDDITKAMFERNNAMVRSSSELLALWNLKPSGTAQAVRIAERFGIPVFNYWQTYQET